MQQDVVPRTITGDAHGIERGIDRGAGVDEEHSAGHEEVANLMEERVDDTVVVRARDHQTHAVPGNSACFGRLVREELVGESEVESCLQHGHAASMAEGSSEDAT